MNDPRMDHLLSEYFDGQIAPEELAELEASLRARPGAREAFWDEAGMHAALRERGLERAGLSEARAASQRARGRHWPRWITAAAGRVAAGIVVGALCASAVWAYAGRQPTSASMVWREGQLALRPELPQQSARLPAGLPTIPDTWGGDDATVVPTSGTAASPVFRFDRAEGEPNILNSPANACDIFRIVPLGSLQQSTGITPAGDQETILELSAVFCDDRAKPGDAIEFGCRIYAFPGDPATLRRVWPAVLREVASVGAVSVRSTGGKPNDRLALAAKCTIPPGVDYVMIHLLAQRPGRSSIVPAEFHNQYVGDITLNLRTLPAQAKRK